MLHAGSFGLLGVRQSGREFLGVLKCALECAIWVQGVLLGYGTCNLEGLMMPGAGMCNML
jgi:hypothetical protein